LISLCLLQAQEFGDGLQLNQRCQWCSFFCCPDRPQSL